MNRITDAIDRLRPRVAALAPEAHARCDEAGRIDAEECCAYQDVKSRAQAMDLLNLEEASFIYCHLEGGPSTFNNSPLENRIVIMQTIKEIMTAERAAMSA